MGRSRATDLGKNPPLFRAVRDRSVRPPGTTLIGIVREVARRTVAKINEFHEVALDSTRIHEGVNCGWRIFSAGGERILQLDTYGSEARKIPGKVSQSIQLDESAARQLIEIVLRAFPGVKRTIDPN
jgi:hypothetical protein